MEDKNKALELREQEIGRLVPQISTREARLVEQEGALTQRDVELTQRQQEVERRTQDLKDAEARLLSRKQEIDQKTAELLRREGAVAARGTGVVSPAGGPSTTSQDLVAREVRLQQFKATLDEANVALGRRSREASERAKAAETSLTRAARKEAALASREAALKQREAELADLLKAADGRRTQVRCGGPRLRNAARLARARPGVGGPEDRGPRSQHENSHQPRSGHRGTREPRQGLARRGRTAGTGAARTFPLARGRRGRGEFAVARRSVEGETSRSPDSPPWLRPTSSTDPRRLPLTSRKRPFRRHPRPFQNGTSEGDTLVAP